MGGNSFTIEKVVLLFVGSQSTQNGCYGKQDQLKIAAIDEGISNVRRLQVKHLSMIGAAVLVGHFLQIHKRFCIGSCEASSAVVGWRNAKISSLIWGRGTLGKKHLGITKHISGHPDAYGCHVGNHWFRRCWCCAKVFFFCAQKMLLQRLKAGMFGFPVFEVQKKKKRLC